MTARTRHRTDRGMTILEVLVASAILLVAMLGLVATMNYAATSTAIGHRRTTTTLLRGELIDRLTVMPRTSPTLAALAAKGDFVIDGCFDGNATLLASNVGYASSSKTFCPAGTLYQSWVTATANANSSWTVSVYVERTDRSCAAAARYSSIGCSAADLLLTD